jgi:hypothetical protein
MNACDLSVSRLCGAMLFTASLYEGKFGISFHTEIGEKKFYLHAYWVSGHSGLYEFTVFFYSIYVYGYTYQFIRHNCEL